jgi:hypothetical protein
MANSSEEGQDPQGAVVPMMMMMITPRQTHNLEDQGLDYHLLPVRHNSQDHMTAQASPLRERTDTYGGLKPCPSFGKVYSALFQN